LFIIIGLKTSVLAQEVMSSTILEQGKILYSKSEATIFIDAVGQAEVGVAYKGRIFICTLGNNFIAASGKKLPKFGMLFNARQCSKRRK
jgi:hypothetical protein